MINKKSKFTKVIAVIGTILIWLPIFFTIITGFVGSIAYKKFMFDYLIPAEMFPLILCGTLLLLWTSVRCGIYKRRIIWTLVFMIASIVACQGAAVITGLASGRTEAEGWPLFFVMLLLVLYIAAVITQGIFGILLFKKLKQ